MSTTQYLSNAQELAQLSISSINTDVRVKTRLLGMGLGEGNIIDILRNRRGDIVLSSGNSRISLGRSITEKIIVTAAAAA